MGDNVPARPCQREPARDLPVERSVPGYDLSWQWRQSRFADNLLSQNLLAKLDLRQILARFVREVRMDKFDARIQKGMKMTRKLSFALHLMLVTLLAVVAGCKTSNYETGNATAGVLKASAGKLQTAKGQVDSTLTALNDLVDSPTNLPAQYKRYSDAVAGLQSSAKDVAAEITDMRTEGDAYFQAWDQQAAQIKNVDIKTRSMSRKKEVLDRFTKVKLSYTQVSDAYHPFMSDLQDIQTALGTDLTADGITAIKGPAQKANEDAIPLKKAGDDMSADLKDLGTAMYSSVPAPATATALK
jgi:hypothetical protein